MLLKRQLEVSMYMNGWFSYWNITPLNAFFLHLLIAFPEMFSKYPFPAFCSFKLNVIYQYQFICVCSCRTLDKAQEYQQYWWSCKSLWFDALQWIAMNCIELHARTKYNYLSVRCLNLINLQTLVFIMAFFWRHFVLRRLKRVFYVRTKV